MVSAEPIYATLRRIRQNISLECRLANVLGDIVLLREWLARSLVFDELNGEK